MTVRTAAQRRVDQIAERVDGKEFEVWIGIYAPAIYREGRRSNRARDALRHVNMELREAGGLAAPSMKPTVFMKEGSENA